MCRLDAPALCVLLVLLLSGCAARSADERPAQPVPADAGSAGPRTAPPELVVAAGLPFRPSQLDPIRWRGGWTEASCLYLGRLFETGLDGSIEPDLALSVRHAPGGRTVTVELHREVFWHDGEPFTAGDVVETLRWIFARPDQTRVDNDLAAVTAWRATDDHTVEIDLSRPWPRIEAALSRFPIVRPDTMGGPGLPAGTGAYRIVARSDDGNELLFEAHDRYHLRPRPAIPRIRLRHVPSDSERADLFAAGVVQLANVREQEGKRIGQPVRLKSGAWRGLVFNGRSSWLSDRRVREAIMLAIDRRSLVEDALEGFGRIATVPAAPGSWIYPAEVPPPDHDPERARALVREAGVEGATLRLLIWKDDRFQRRADFLLMLWLDAIGIKLEGNLADTETFSARAQEMGEGVDAYIGGWNVLADPIMELEKRFHSKGIQNYGGYSDPETDRLIEAALVEPDTSTAAALSAAVLKRVAEECVILPLVYPDYLFARHPQLHGIEEGTVLDSWREITRFAHRWSWGAADATAQGGPGAAGSTAGIEGREKRTR
jgi:peptide/nickel transport system substrate-binding protein